MLLKVTAIKLLVLISISVLKKLTNDGHTIIKRCSNPIVQLLQIDDNYVLYKFQFKSPGVDPVDKLDLNLVITAPADILSHITVLSHQHT